MANEPLIFYPLSLTDKELKTERKKGGDETSSTLVPSGKWAGSRGQIVKILKS